MRIVLFSIVALNIFVNVSCMQITSTEEIKENSKDSSLFILANKIRSADSILLTSHIGDSTGMIRTEIMIGDKINREIIKEKKVITGSDIDTLISILSMPKSGGDTLKCGFEPHHSIFIINQNKVSYIDLWFTCYGESTSRDLKNILPLGIPKFEKLFFFFKKHGFKYKMPEIIFPYKG